MYINQQSYTHICANTHTAYMYTSIHTLIYTDAFTKISKLITTQYPNTQTIQ